MWRGEEVGETKRLIQQVYNTLALLPWSGDICGFEANDPILKLHTYTTNNWLSDTHENQMLDLLRRKLCQQPNGLQVLVENTFFINYLQKGYECQEAGEYESSKYFARLRETGFSLGSGVQTNVGFVANIHDTHWVGVILDFACNIIYYGDSLGCKMDAKLAATLQWWTRHHSGQKFTHQDLAITRQDDTFSCGVLAFNAIAHHLLPSHYPLVPATLVANERLKTMLEVTERHFNQSFEATSKGYQFTF
ncbi:hypothetical protein BU15DRAFT_50062, partial [Melanogaster broomeanus]